MQVWLPEQEKNYVHPAFMLFVYIFFPFGSFNKIDYSISIIFRNQILENMIIWYCANIASLGGNILLRTVETSGQAISTEMEINLVEITDELLFLHLKATVWTHIIFKIKLIVNSYWKMFMNMNYNAPRFDRQTFNFQEVEQKGLCYQIQQNQKRLIL